MHHIRVASANLEREITLDGGEKVTIVKVYTTAGTLGFVAWLLQAAPTAPTGRARVQDTIDEVLLANLMQRMEDRGEVFEHVAEYCVYLVLVYERTDGSRALVGAYVGSAGRRGQSYLCAYEHRAGDRNRSILNHAGKGDSNLSVFLASKKAAIASGTLA
eukprot:jgi/Chrpa1/1039/Chrysochromulina_OHIO_Genome00008490-RA